MTLLSLSLALSLALVYTANAGCKSSLTTDEQAALDVHNKLRALHNNTQPLCYGESGTNVTFNAEYIASKYIWGQDVKTTGFEKGEYGESWGQISTSTKATSNGEDYTYGVTKWYEGGNYYDYASSSGSTTANKFTQIVWRNTTQVNCGYASKGSTTGTISSGTFAGTKFTMYQRFLICQYYPPGNVADSFVENVGPLIPVEEEKKDPVEKDPVDPTKSSSAVGMFNAALVTVMVAFAMYMD